MKVAKRNFQEFFQIKQLLIKKLADKRKRRVDAVDKLQKEEVTQAKKVEKQQKNIYAAYEQQIEELTKQLFQRESNGGKLILPIWHNITKQEVQRFSPSLAGKMAMNTAIMTPDEIAEKLNELLSDER